MPVGGSRHYQGGGLGPIAGWACPSCGAENQGPLEQGCGICGAGRPGRHVGTPPPPAPPAPPEPEPEPEPEPPAAPPRVNLAHLWIDRHPDATVEEAFTAGYIEGVREAQRQIARANLPPPVEPTFTPDGAVNRTVIAALELFREQVLIGDPDEVATGEWLSAHQVSGLIRQLQGEIAHA